MTLSLSLYLLLLLINDLDENWYDGYGAVHFELCLMADLGDRGVWCWEKRRICGLDFLLTKDI
jgi:hypothetical protein